MLARLGQQLRVEQWTTFYVIVLFVVITLAAERGLKDKAGIRIYLTPTVIYFNTVLVMTALLTVPTQTWLTAI